ncbi:unnamed protein product [Brassica rapa subsp. trilocularis]
MADQISYARTRIQRFSEIDNANGECYHFRSRVPFKSFDECLQENRSIFSGTVPPIEGYSRRHHSHETEIGYQSLCLRGFVIDNIGWCYTVLHVNPFCPRQAITHLTGGECSGWKGFNLNALLNPFQAMYRVCERNWIPVKQKNARNMRKAILLSKRTLASSRDTNALPHPQGMRRRQPKKKEKCSTSKLDENPILACSKCGALMWTSESTGTDHKTGEPTFTLCCNHGQIRFPPINQPPALLEKLLQTRWFRDTIRVYNSVLAFTSVGMKMDYSVVHAPAKIFRRARDHCESVGSEFVIRLVSDKGKRKEYDLPSTNEQIRDDHPLYMSLQYPLLFPYGEYGFHPEIPLHLETGTSRTRHFVTIRKYYASLIQTRLNQGMTLIKGGRLLHQFVVDVYTAIEEDRLRFILPPSFTGGPRYLKYGGDSPNVRPDIESGAVLENTFVVPHNIKLVKKYEAHINVEWCNRTSAVKYLFKYITKGVDRATAVIENGNTAATSDATGSGGSKEKVVRQRNEIQDYIEARYLSACESMWRTFAFHIHKRKPSVEKLIIHLEGEHNITVKSTDILGLVIRKPGIEKTMFTEWMVLCRRSEFPRTLTYVQIP